MLECTHEGIDSPRREKAKDEMNAKIKAAESEVKKKQDEILRMKADIEKQAPMLSATALRQEEDLRG